ncbi:MAG TPA: hypothetical protein VG944_08435 [Fimbriimonas sp.]|nr:hypothetical protein [Fimbriimonas sp.]
MLVRIEQYSSPKGDDCSAPPLPLAHDFKENTIYRVHAWVIESGELRAVMVNDKGEVWGVSNRHLRYENG